MVDADVGADNLMCKVQITDKKSNIARNIQTKGQHGNPA